MSYRLCSLLLCLTISACSGFPVVVRTEPAEDPGVAMPASGARDRGATFVTAYHLFRQADYEASAPIFVGLVKSFPEIADYPLYYGAAALRRSGEAEAAVPLLRQLRRDYPNSTLDAAASLELGQALATLGRGDEARPFLQIAQASGRRALVNPARLALADADEHHGEYQAAASGFLEVRRAAAGTALGTTAKKRLQALRAQYPVLDPSGRMLVDEARLLLSENDYRSARATVEALLHTPVTQRGGVEDSELLRLLADILYGMDDLDRALALLRNLGDRYPGTDLGAGALQRRAMILWNRDRDEEALGAFTVFLERYPRHARAAEALYAIGRIHQQAGHPDLAIAAYERVARDYPRSSVAGESRWRVAWVHYRNQRYDRAAAAFAALAGSGHDGAAYWQARALDHAGRGGAARELYQRILHRDPEGYYGLWAERRLGRARGAGLMTAAGDMPPIAAPQFPPAPELADSFHLDRARALASIGVLDLARDELAAIEDEYGDDPAVDRFLLAAYPAVDGHTNVLRRLRKGKHGLSAEERESLLYPLAFWTQVQEYATTNDLDPLLIVALMRQESLFDPRAHSPAGARGLMQLMPKTAQHVATSIGKAGDDLDLEDPHTNIELGSRYLGGLIARYGADPLKAIAAYNAGEAAVDKWQNRYGHLDPDELVESITYRETRDYVKKVVANYRKYKVLYR